MSFFVYIHTCPNGKKYVGITTKLPEKRWRDGKGYKHQKYFYRAINKYGWDNIKHEYFETKSQKLMEFWEIILIHYYNTLNPNFGYNRIQGGIHAFGWEMPESAKIKIGNFSKGRKLQPLSDKTKKKISESLKGRKHSEEHRKHISDGGKGRKHSEETKKKISESAKGRVFTKEHRIALSKSLTGQRHSEETKKKMSKTRLGHPVSEETRRKISEAKKLYWENKRKNNT